MFNDAYYFIYSTESVDYESTIDPDVAILNQTSNVSCHSVMIYDDEDVEPPENFSVIITATGPTQEFIDLFDILPDTIVQIVDNDSELLRIQWKSIALFYEMFLYTHRSEYRF